MRRKTKRKKRRNDFSPERFVSRPVFWDSAKMKKRFGPIPTRALPAWIVLTALVLSFAAAPAGAQVQFPRPKKDDRGPQKNLTGQVVDKEGKGLPEAIVYLKDKKTLETKTHISDDHGGYKFSGLDPNSDYEVHAELKGASSPKRHVSSLDDRKDVYLVLEIGSE